LIFITGSVTKNISARIALKQLHAGSTVRASSCGLDGQPGCEIDDLEQTFRRAA
jgi:hypothetical protein